MPIPVVDVLLVGAGLTAAAVAARLRQVRPHWRLLAVDARPHLAGNCYDETADRGTRVHRYGPHVFHSPNARVVDFLSRFTAWTPINDAVTAEAEVDGRVVRVPFPYSRQTAAALGRELTGEEVVDTFFCEYSRKMWGRSWDDLPPAVRARVPSGEGAMADESHYFPGQFVALPRDGYTAMIERMFEGCDVRLGVGPRAWLDIQARHVVYTGRPDALPRPDAGDGVTLGTAIGLTLPYRTVDINFAERPDWPAPTPILNVCHSRSPSTRQTCYRLLTGGGSDVVSIETPREAAAEDLTPFYPVVDGESRAGFARLKALVGRYYPNLVLAGRLGSHQYLDMYQAVGQGFAVAERLAGVASERIEACHAAMG